MDTIPYVRGINLGDTGQTITIKNQSFYIGEVIKLFDLKTKYSCNYEIKFSFETFKVYLHNPNNCLVTFNYGLCEKWYNKGLIDLYEITLNLIPYIEIQKIEDQKTALKDLHKHIKRCGTKPVK